MESNLTYKCVIDRCKALALEIAPSLPTTGTLESWESFVDEVESVRDDSMGLVLESVESTDWAIYTHFGWKILHALPQSYINQAEESYLEFNGDLTLNESFGGCFDVWSMQSAIAFHALVILTQESLDDCLGELEDLAQTQIDNLES